MQLNVLNHKKKILILKKYKLFNKLRNQNKKYKIRLNKQKLIIKMNY